MSYRAILVAVLLAMTTHSIAAPVLVEFVGEISGVADDAPDQFSIGELVRGAFVYDPNTTERLAIKYTFTQIDSGGGNPPAGWPSQYEAFPADDDGTLYHQLFLTGAFGIESQSGFAAVDLLSEFSWVSGGGSSVVTSRNSGAFRLGTRGLFSNQFRTDESRTDTQSELVSSVRLLIPEYVGQLTPSPVSGSTLVTLHGSVASAMTLNLVAPEVDPNQVDADGLYPLSAIAPADAFPGITSGSIAFGPVSSPYDNPSGSRGVSFVVTDSRVTAVPETTTRLLACLVVLAHARHRRRVSP